jgi:hypothetical protein
MTGSSLRPATRRERVLRLEAHGRGLEHLDAATMSSLDRLDPAEERAAATRAAGMLCDELLVLLDREQNREIAPAAVDDGGPLGRIAQDLGEPALGFGDANPTRGRNGGYGGLLHGHHSLQDGHERRHRGRGNGTSPWGGLTAGEKLSFRAESRGGGGWLWRYMYVGGPD